VTLAAGMACEGAHPVVVIYSTFLQRAYDQLIHDVALQNLPVLFAIDRAGVVGPDGPTHAGSFDMSYLRCIPNMLVMAPADENECRQMLTTGFRHDGPAAVRYPRGSGPGVATERELTTLPIGRAQVRLHGGAGGKSRRGIAGDRGQHALRQTAGRGTDPETGAHARGICDARRQCGRGRRGLGRGRSALIVRHRNSTAATGSAGRIPGTRQPRGIAFTGRTRCGRNPPRDLGSVPAVRTRGKRAARRGVIRSPARRLLHSGIVGASVLAT